MMGLYFLLAVASSQTCAPISCGGLSELQCFARTKQSIYVSSCSPDQYCNITSLNSPNVSCTAAPASRYPGDYCALHIECTSGTCLPSGFCAGPGFLQPCDPTVGCAVGFYCTDSVCQSQLKPGSACTSDFQCVNSAFCNLGVCTLYWSLLISDAVEPPVNGFSFGCKSGAAVKSGTGYVCASAEASAEQPTECTLGTVCSSEHGTFNSSCMCGYNPNGISYCPLFPGDPQFQKLLQASSAVFANNSICNSYSRFSLRCFVAYQDWLETFLEFGINLSLTFGNTFALVQNSTYCIVSNLVPEYFELANAYDGLYTQVCPSYYCSFNSELYEPNQCVTAVQDLNNGVLTQLQYVSGCSEGYYCNYVDLTSNTTCSLNTVSPGYPGDFCNKSSECLSNRCLDHFCLGIREGEICKNPFDCQPGFFCNQTSFVCQVLKKRLESCSYWYECSNVLVCNLGTCINYYSLQNYEGTNLYDNGYSIACISGFAVPSGNYYLCSPAPVSAKKDTCLEVGDRCMDSTGVYSKVCQCSIGVYTNGDGCKVFCPPFEGDIYLQNAIANFIVMLNWNQVCNTFSRFSEACYLRNNEYLGNYYYYATNLTYYKHYSMVYNVPDCVLKNYMPDEYMNQVKLQAWLEKNSKHPGDNDDSRAATLVLMLLTILVNAI